jgi:hypothetical protein
MAVASEVISPWAAIEPDNRQSMASKVAGYFIDRIFMFDPSGETELSSRIDHCAIRCNQAEVLTLSG